MPRFRFAIRRMMVVVAVVGIACGFEVLRRRRDDGIQKVATHGDREAFFRAGAEFRAEPRDARREEDIRRKSLAASRRHARLKLKYERVARYPWLPVEPDEPAPNR